LGNRFECPFDLLPVPAFVLPDEYQPLIEIELAQNRMRVLDLTDG